MSGEKNSGILEVLNSNTSSSLLDSQIQDQQIKQQEQSFGFDTEDSNTKSDEYRPEEPKRGNSFGIKLSAKEEKERETGTTQFTGGVIRVSDSSTALEDTDFKSARELYEQTLGVTQYDSLRKRLGLKDGESYTDYYNRTGYIPAGFEMEAKLLLAEEKRKQLYSEYVAGKISETDFLYEAYGKDIMKMEGHDLGSTLYWYQRAKDGYTDSPLDNDTYMAGVIYQARQQFEAEEWFEKSQTFTLNNSLASYLADGVIPTGEELDAITLRELFREQFVELDQYYESSEKVIDLYRSGLLSGFDPTLDIDHDGKVDYYYHTDGKLYAIEGEGSKGVGSAKAYAYYNDDGSLNRITLTGSKGGEIGQQVIKGFTNIFTEAIGFVGTLFGGIYDLVEGITGNGWDLSATTDVMAGWQKFLNNDSFAFGNDGYIVDSGFKTSDGDINWMAIGRGAGAAVGTVAEIAATVALSVVTGGGYGALKVGSKAAAKGATKVIGKTVKEVGEKAVKATIKKGIVELGEKAVKTAGKKISQKVLEEATEKAFKELGEEVTQEALEKAIKKGLKDIVLEVGEEGIETATKKVTKKVLDAAGNVVLDAAGKEVTEEVSEKILTSSINNSIEQLGTGLLTKAAKPTIGGVAKGAVKFSTNFVLKTTGVANGTPWLTRTAWGNTIESIAMMGVKDFLQTGVQLTVNQEQLDLSTAEIIGKSLGVASLNAGISLLLRSVQDTTAMDRWAIMWQKNVNKAAKNKATAKVSSAFLNTINKWKTANFRSFMAVNSAMDVIENMSTMYFQNSVAQTGQFFNADVFRSTMSNPQMVFTQAAMAYQSVKGGWGTKVNPLTKRIAEGAETGGIMDKLDNINNIFEDVTTYLKKASANVTNPEDAKAVTDLVLDLQNRVNNAEDPILGMTDALAFLHNTMQDAQGNSFVKDIIMDAVKKRVSADTVAEMQVATAHYNASVAAYDKISNDSINGKVGKWMRRRQKAIIDLTSETIRKYCTKFNSSSYEALIRAFQSDLSSRPDATKINSAIKDSVKVVKLAGNFEWKKDDKTGKYVYTIVTNPELKDPDVLNAIKAYLEEGALTPEDLVDCSFIKVEGVGTAKEGTQEYKDLTEALDFYNTLSQQDEEQHDNSRRLIYKLSDKNNLYLAPSLKFGPGLDMANINNIGEALRALHFIKYAQDGATRLEMLKLFPDFFIGNDGNNPVFDLDNLIKQLTQSKILTMSQAASLAAELDEATYNKLKNEKPKPNFIEYKEAVDILQELEVYSSKELTDSDRNKVRGLLDKYENINAEVKKEILKDNVINSEMLESVKKTIVNPHKSQDYFKTLQTVFLGRSSDEIDATDTIKFLATILNNQQEAKYSTIQSFEEYSEKAITDSQVKEFLGSDLMKGINITTLTKKELEAKILEYSNSKTLDNAEFSKKVSNELTLYKIDMLEKLRDSDEILYDTMLTKFIQDNNLTDMNREDKVNYLIESEDFFEYYSAVITPQNLVEKLGKTYDLHKALYSGAVDAEGTSTIYLDLTQLVGATHAKLLERLTNPTVQSDLANAGDSETDFLRTIFGDRSITEIKASLAREQAVLEVLRRNSVDGYVSFDMENHGDALNKLFKDLGYNYTAITQNEQSLIPGVYFKKGYNKALEFKLSKKKKNGLLAAISTKLGFKNKTKELTVANDIISQFDSLLGGLVYLDDDTMLSPSRLILSSVDMNGEVNFTSGYSALEMFNALGKQGKLAGASSKILTMANHEVGIQSTRNESLRRYELLLTAIDSLAKLHGKDASQLTLSRVMLTEEEADVYNNKDSGALWKLSKDSSNSTALHTPDGKTKSFYIVERKFDNEADFKEAALKLLREGTEPLDLNLICPVYSCDATNKDLIMNAYGLNYQNTLGYSPITRIILDLSAKATKTELLDLFMKPLAKEYTNFDTEPVLEFFKGTIKEIKSKSVPSELEANPYYHMMRNAFEAALSVSEYIKSDIIKTNLNISETLIKLLGNKKARRFIGATLFKLKETASIDEIKLALKEGLKDIDNIEEYANVAPSTYLEYLDFSEKDKAFFSGNQSTLFKPTGQITDTLIDSIEDSDIKTLRELITYSSKVPNNFSEVEDNAFIKLYNHLQTSKSSVESEDTLHFYITDLYEYSKEEFEEVKHILSMFLSKEDIALLDTKFKTISKETDLYNNKHGSRIFGERLKQGTGNDATLEHNFQVISKKGSKDKSAYKQSIQWALDKLKTGYKKKLNYKISDMDSIAYNQEHMMLKSLANLLNIKVLDGINRQGSLLIQNIEIKEKLGQLIGSIAETSAGLKDLWVKQFGGATNNLPSDTFNQIALAMYLHSSGMDYQSEWTKYLFINLDTGQIEYKAQSMAGAKSLNDLLYTAKNVFQEIANSDDTNPARYMVINLEKNMLLSNSPTSGKLKYSILDKDSLPVWRRLFVDNALYQWNNNPFYEKTAAGLNVNSDVEKALFVYASTPTQKRNFEDIISELVSNGVDEESARLAIMYDMDDLQSSKSTNSAAEQLFQNDLIFTRSERDREKFNIQQKTLSDVMKYNITYRGLPDVLRKELAEAYTNSNVMKYTFEENGKTITRRIKDTETVIKALLSGNSDNLELALLNYKDKNKNCSEEQLMNALAYTYMFKSKEASALSFLLSGNDFDYFKGLRNNITEWKVKFKDSEIPMDKLFEKGCFSIDLESFYKGDTTMPFQITITHIDANGKRTSKTIFVPVKANGVLITTVEDIKNNFPKFYSEYYEKNEGTRNAVAKYFDFVNKTKTVEADYINKEVNTFFKSFYNDTDIKDIPVIGFNNSVYDNIHIKAAGLSEDSIWFKNSIDVYNDIFKKVYTSYDLNNKENLADLVRQLKLEEKYGIKLDGAHDAEVDTIAAYLVSKHIAEGLIDINKSRLDMFYDLETLGKRFFNKEDFSIDSLKDILQSEDFRIKNLNEEATAFVNNYKDNFKTKDISSKIKAHRKLQALYDSQERDINMKRYRKEYAIAFTKDQRDIVDLLNDSTVNNNLSRVIAYIKKQSKLDLNQLIPKLAEAIRDAYGKSGSFKEKQFLTLLRESPEEIINKLKLTNKDIFANVDVKDFETNGKGLLSPEEIEQVKKDLDLNKLSNELYEESLIDDYYSFNKDLNKFLDDDKLDFLDDELKAHLFMEANKFYTDTRGDDDYPIHLKRKRIVNNLSERQLEFLKHQPIRKITFKTLYKLVQATPHNAELTILDYNGKPVKERAHSDTIYVSKEAFEKLMGVSYEMARKYYQTKDGEDIYFTALRQPLDKPDAIQNYKIKITTTKNVEVMMSPDVLKALHGGDNDGDHINLVRPSKATQEFARKVLPITKAAWTMLDKVFEDLESDLVYSIKNTKLTIGAYDVAMDVFKDSIEDDLNKLINREANYNNLRNKRLNELKENKTFKDFTDKDFEDLMDIAWIKQDLDPFESANLSNYIYLSHSKHLSKSETNLEQIRIANDHKAVLRKWNAYADSVSGVIQKGYGKYHVINSTVSRQDIDKFFHFAGFDLAPNTIQALSTAIANPTLLAKLKDSFKNSISTVSLEPECIKDLEERINNIKSVENFIFTMKLFEDYTKASNANILAEGLEILNTFNKKENIYEDYDNVLQKYLQGTQGKFLDEIGTTAEMMDALLEGTDDYFSDTSIETGYVTSLIDAKLQELRNGNTKRVKGVDYKDFKNKVRGKIVYALNSTEDIPEDTVRLLPGAANYRYSHILMRRLDDGEQLVAKLNKPLKLGEKLTNNVTVTEELVGYKVVRHPEEGYILVKTKGIDGTSKIAIPGSSATKGTITLNSNLDNLFSDCVAITKMSEYAFNKISGETLSNSKIVYYDENGKEIKNTNDKIKAAYAVVETDIGIAEDTAFWDSSVKTSILDEVAVGMNQQSYEGMVLLGKYYIPTESFTGEEFTLDNSKIIKIEEALERMKNPRWVSTNGIYTYKALLLTTLLEYDTSMSVDEKRAYLKTKLSQKSFIGENGTIEIFNRLKAIKQEDLDKFINSLPKFQQKLFDEELLGILFNIDVAKYNLEGTEQLSKKSHGSKIRALLGVIGPAKHVSGTLAESLNIKADGKTVHSMADSYIPLLFLRQKLHEGYGMLSADKAKQLTSSKKIPSSKGYAGNQINNFYGIDERFAEIYDSTYNPNVDKKTGVKADQTLNIRPNTSGTYIASTSDNKINLKLSGLGEHKRQRPSTKEPGVSTKDYKALSTDRITQYLLAGLSAHNKQDTYSFAHSLFEANENKDLTLAMNRRHLTLTPEGEYLVKPQSITGYTNTDVYNYYDAINKSFSSAQTMDNYKQSYQSLIDSFKDEFDYTKGNYIALPTLKETAASRFEMKVTPKIYNNAFEYTTRNSFMPRQYYEGRDDRMTSVYKSDFLETSNIKLDSKAAINADRIAKYLKVEGEAITYELNNQYFKLYHMAEHRKVLPELNEYAFLTGTLDRINRLKAIKDTDSNADKALKVLIESLPYPIEECETKVKGFESLYPEIIEPFKEMTAAAVALAQRYANLTLEPTANPFFLLVPNVYTPRDKSTEAEVAYIKSMFLNTSLYINATDTKHSYATYAGYNFFESMPHILKQIASQAAIYNGSQRLKEQGYMRNSDVFGHIDKFFKEHKATFESLDMPKDTTYSKKDEFIKHHLHILNKEFPGFESLYLDKLNGKSLNTLGAHLLSMYEVLQDRIEGKTYSEVRQGLRDNDTSKRREAEELVKAFEYSNDILANLCDAAGSDLLIHLGREIYENRNNSSMVAVDNWGRKLNEDLTKFKTLSKASLEYIPEIIKYYMGGKNNFYKNVALSAINGDVYYMPRDLADIMDKEVFVNRPPKTIQKHLIKLQNIAVKLLMSSPFKLLDRILKYTGFDLAALGMANPRTLLKQGQARTELSALWGSKGAILDKVNDDGSYAYDNLREFLYTQGIDPNSTDVAKLIQGETGSSKGKGPLQGYFNLTNKAFSYQNLFERYAFWLATKEDLQKGKGSYGSTYYNKDLVNSIEGLEDEFNPGKYKVTKEGNQAAFIMAQNIGAPGDFPALSKRLQGYATFTTFPLALLRWGKGEIYSMATAFKNLFVEGESKGAMKYLAYNGGGILGIYLVTNLLTSILCDMFSIPEEQEDEWKEEQAIPDVFRTIIQGSPVMDTYSSINPLKELGDMTVGPFVESMVDDDKDTDIVTALGDWFLENIVGHVNPVVKGGVETVTGYDVIGNDVISTKDEYNIWENFARKAGAYIIGSAGANAIAKYNNSYESQDDTSSERIYTGLSRAVDAELGNTKVYKSNQKNYYKALDIVNAFLYADSESNYYSENFNQQTYKSLKNDIAKALHNKAKMTDIYAIIEDYIEAGASFAEIKAALNNNSLRYKLTRIDTSDKFLQSLTETELNCIKSAIAYEDYIFPWIDTIIEDLTKKFGKDDKEYKRVYYKYRPNRYYDYDNSNYKTYNNSNYIKGFKPYSNYTNTYSPSDTYDYMMNAWKYGKSTDLYGNKYSGYTNIKGDTWTWDGGNK